VVDFFKPAQIDPVRAMSSVSAELVEVVYDSLFEVDRSGRVKPELVESWSRSGDGLRWSFNIRRGIRFHDGSELTALDVKYTIDEVLSPKNNSMYRAFLDPVKEVRVVNRYRVDIILKQPFPLLLYYLDFGIAKKGAKGPIGTGPFMVERFGEREIILKANRHYFKGMPRLDRVIVKIERSQKLCWARLMRGEADLFYRLSPDDFDIIKRISYFRAYSFLVPYYYMVIFNNGSRIFRDRDIRVAMNYAVDKERILRLVLKGYGKIAAGVVYPRSWAYNKKIEPYPYDPKKALDILKKEGWTDHDGNHIIDRDGKQFRFTLYTYSGSWVVKRVALLIQEDLLNIGIRMDIKSLTIDRFNRILFNKRFDAAILYIVYRIDPDILYSPWHSPPEGLYNIGNYRDREVDRLLELGRELTEPDKRKKLYFKVQEEMKKDPPGIFLFWRSSFIGIDKKFKGVEMEALNPFKNLDKWYISGGGR